MTDLPDGWSTATLGAATAPRTGKVVPGPNDTRPYLSLDGLQEGTATITGWEHAANYRSQSAQVFPGDVAYSRLRPYLNKVGLVDRAGLGSSELIVFPPSKALDPSFFLFLLSSADFVRFANANSDGDRPRLKWKQMGQFVFGLPPLAEQRRIVAAIEEHFSRLDAAEVGLESAKNRVAGLEVATLRTLLGPTSTVTLESISLGMRYGTSVKCSYDADGPAVMRIPNVAKGQLLLDDLKYATEPDAVADSAFAQPGEILFVRTNGSRNLIGRSACIPEGPPRAFASYLIGMTVDESKALPAYVNRVMESPSVRRQLVAAASTSAGQYNLSVGKIGATEIPLPHLARQRELVAKMSGFRSEVELLRGAIDTSALRTAGLRRAILAAAFSGQLVPQDAADEPVSVLLERVAVERAALKPSRKRKKAAS